MAQPHPTPALQVCCAVITVSDSRTIETDRSGQLLHQLLQEQGHQVSNYKILPDEPQLVQAHLVTLSQQPNLHGILINGGTGIAVRDTTYEAIAGLLEKTLPGFGELFRWLSFQEIGSRAIASRAVAGVYQGKLVFSLPGSTNAVRLAMQQLILPELPHLVSQLHQSSS